MQLCVDAYPPVGPGRLPAGVAASLFGVEWQEIGAPTRRAARVSQARHVAIYLAHVGLRHPREMVSRDFGRHRTTVGHSCARVEDSRDDPATDWSLDVVEAALRAYAQAFLGRTREGAR